MIPKILQSGYSDNLDFPASQIIPAFSKGFETSGLKKSASMFTDVINTFERKPGYEYIHLISVADGCTYGPNSRADFYNGEPCEIKIPYPEKGRPNVIILDGGISKYHNTFMKSGGVYTEHRNKHSKNPPKSQGYIVAEAYNRPMKRGELIIGVNDEAWRDDLDSLAKGNPLKFSIGFDATHDICGLCNHIAHTEDEHCDHVKYQPGQWDDKGNAIFMISDQGVYHDISRVRVPAERIAFSLRKVATGAEELLAPTTNPDALRWLLKTAHAIKRYETVKKLAKIEKQIPAAALDDELNKHLLKKFALKKTESDDAVDVLHRFIDFAHMPEVLGGLKERRCVLNPEEFLRLISPEYATPRNVAIIQGGLPGIFGDIWQRADLDEFCEDTAYASHPCLDLRILRSIDDIQPTACVDTRYLLDSIIDGGLTNKKNVTIICVKNTDNDLSREYASYFADACADLDEQEQLLALLRALTKQGN